MGRPAGWMKGLTGRSPMKSPGAPSLRRDGERLFWREIAKGLTSEEAALAVGASQAAGSRWFRDRGGMPSFMLAPITGRYLSFPEREEIAMLKAQGTGVREIARRLGPVLGARVLAEFGDDPTRYADAKARRNYAGTSPITRQSGKEEDRPGPSRAQRPTSRRPRQAGLRRPHRLPGARTYYDQQRHRGISHHAALRQLGNRLVGILHGCLKTGTRYDETTAWQHRHQQSPAAAA